MNSLQCAALKRYSTHLEIDKRYRKLRFIRAQQRAHLADAAMLVIERAN